MAELIFLNLNETIAGLKSVQKQIPFVLAQTLNETGKAIQKEVINELLPEKFILAGRQRRARGAPWWKPGNALGFNLKFAKKSQGDAMQTVLGSRADWLALQELGGTKRARGGRVAVPEGIKKSPADIITSAKRPRRLMQSKKAFTLPLKSGDVGIFRRIGKRPGEIELLYLLEPAVQISPTLEFSERTTAAVKYQIGHIFNRELKKALSTAKK